MKYAIDYKPGSLSISGWAATKDGGSFPSSRVMVCTLRGKCKSVLLDTYREDVKAAGIHAEGVCGFFASLEDLGVRQGDFVKIDLLSEGVVLASRVLLIGKAEQCNESFFRLEYDRKDFSVMEKPPLELFVDFSDYIVLKLLIIRLRRGKRALGWRGTFVGYEYPWLDSDLNVFRSLIDSTRFSLLGVLPVRYLWSLIDTLADYGEAGERGAALSVSAMMMHERFSQTFKNIFEMKVRDEPVLDRQLVYWGSMATNRLELDDSFDCFLTRQIENLAPYPLVYILFVEIMTRMVQEPSSTFGVNYANSVYFKEAWKFYADKFSKDKAAMRFGGRFMVADGA